MESISTLQQQFHLSPKKFWKKIIEKFLAIYVIGLISLIFVLSFGLDTVVLAIYGIVLVCVLVINILYAWYVKAYIKRYYYAGEDNFVTIKKGVFAPTEIHVQWQKIQDVYVDQDILDRIMGLYDVHIASATVSSGIEAHIDGVEKDAAEGLKKFFLDKISNKGNSQSNTVETQVKQNTQQATTINLSEEISSKVYPLSTKWTMITLLGRIIGSIFFGAILSFVIFTKSETANWSEDLGYFILCWIGLTLLSVIWNTITLFLWKKNYSFSFNSENIYYKEGVISLSEKHMPYSSIQDVTVQQGVIERFVGLAKVKIENAATQSVMTKNGSMAVFSGVLIQGVDVRDANKITNILKTTVLGKNTSKYGL